MQNAISNRIRLLLNELAILNQPESINGNYFFNVDTLNKIKTLAAELYLCSDQQLPGSVLTDHATGFEEQKPPVSHKFTEKEPLEADEPKTPKPAQEASVIPVDNPVESKPDEIPLIEENLDTPAEKDGSINGTGENVFAGKISLTRKFEYINNLFMGDALAFQEFLDRLSNANSLDEAMNLFSREYEAKNWKRKSEAAADLKILIKKYKL